uniref:Protein kinase domain-containing protein n=1 Tax=Chenopodium quinoa TaxID=63459 RepID=A0A803M5P0_CHEQI
MTNCAELGDVIDGECSGVGCCQASIPGGVNNVQVILDSFHNHSSVHTFNPCNAAFPVAKDAYTFYRWSLNQPVEYWKSLRLPVVLNWTIGRKNCTVVKEDGSCLCKENTVCYDPVHEFGYRCNCTDGYSGNPYHPRGCTGVGGGIITLLLFGFLLHFKREETKTRKIRESFFRQNGGLLLHEKLLGREVDTLKIFTMQELEAACNNFSDENIIGKGGFGVVYKVNNRHVVKLLGCELPLSVYEFINNGTLYDHLNDPAKASILKWNVRLNIASEVANVLSYLHTTISTPIIHRDIKSMNILLDESYTAKVTDFGASRLIPPDKTQFSTMVLGTRGYLDPEYMQTGELTEKSDVYSFGVVLLELLTREKAIISNVRSEAERLLTMHFFLNIKEGRLLDILDINIVKERTIEEIQQMANLARWCLMLKGEERPTMKEVAMELETIKRKGSHIALEE